MALSPILSSWAQNGMNLYMNGLIISRASATTLSVTAGQCRDSTNSFDLNLGNYLGLGNQALTANSATVLNSAVNGVNGLDTGTFAKNTWYYIYVIADQAGYNQPALLMSLSASAPTLPNLALGAAYPSGYSLFRCIGAVISNNSTQWPIIYASGKNSNIRRFQYDAPIAVTVTDSGTSATYSAMDLSTAVPVNFYDQVTMYYKWTPAAAANTLMFQPSGGTGDYHTVLGIVASVAQDAQMLILPLTVASVPKVSYKVSGGTLNSILVEAYSMQL